MKRFPEDMLGRTVIVTGAGNGLGLGIARRFVAGGARVLFVDQDPVVLTRVEGGKAKDHVRDGQRPCGTGRCG